MNEAGRFTIPPEHPSLPGHFPGSPIVPGVVLLDEVLAALPEGSALLSAKFTAPVRPGETVELSCERTGSRLAFAGSVAGQQVLHGLAAVT